MRDKPQLAEKKATSTVTEANIESPASGRTAETPDPVLAKAKATIAAKLKDPVSVEFIEMKRATRKNMMGKPVDTICGRVKELSNEEVKNRPFLYFVESDTAFIVHGAAGSLAERVYRVICSELGATEPPLGPVASDRKIR